MLILKQKDSGIEKFSPPTRKAWIIKNNIKWYFKAVLKLGPIHSKNKLALYGRSLNVLKDSKSCELLAKYYIF